MDKKLTLKIKNWSEFQHYKDRNPIWIKLHRSLLNDFHWQQLPIASKALAPMLWLVASERENATIIDSVEAIAWRAGFPADQFVSALKPLIDNGFIIDASNTLADCYQHASLETETETKKEKINTPSKKISRSASLAEFDLFWNEYPRRVGKGSAVKAFERALTKTDAKTITDGLDRWKRSKDFPTEERFIPHAATWLNAERWLDIPAETTSGYKIYTEEEKLKVKQETQEWLKEWKKSRDQNQQTSGR